MTDVGMLEKKLIMHLKLPHFKLKSKYGKREILDNLRILCTEKFHPSKY